MVTTSFLVLPGEIRNRIYGFCTPVTGYVKEYNGLRFAAKQIRAEYETEALKAMRKYLASIKKEWPHPKELLIISPRNFSGLANVTVQLPISMYYPPHGDESLQVGQSNRRRNDTKMERCLAPLFCLYLSSLTIAYYDDSFGLARYNHSLLPIGLLQDMTNVLVNGRTTPFPSFSNEIRMFEQRKSREFCLDGRLHVRRLIYRWIRSVEIDASEYVSDVEMRNIKFFLMEEWWWQSPRANTLVTNWARKGNSVYFDLKPQAD
ncbi:hypothetical protein K458DRAFT_429874 [Lentithecium fluviatile CBS 122367]|uniref:Uncharacterized protein n=1 Tax=Lentithecium fluviatile CBS 122367 TaxID=1168545 RepID=A0A6G1J8T8_9PLEO|nr:hypothetical protein K458DRAFT_429874 [Lentithecium fluviatile CBS 122367]